jgi:hypothetical protein
LLSSNIGATACFIAVALFYLPFVFSQEPRWALICGIAGVSLFFLKRLSAASIAGLIFIAWAGLSLAWSPDWRNGLTGLGSLIALWAVFATVQNLPSMKWLPIAALLSVLATLVLSWAIVNGGHGNQNWVTEWLLIASPLLLLVPGGAFILVGMALYVANNSSFTEIPVAFGLITIWTFLKKRRWIISAVCLPAITVVIVWYPDLLGADIFSSIRSRTELYINTGYLWLEAPLFGHGFGGFNYEYSRVQEAHLQILPIGTVLYSPVLYVGSAHNEFLQGLAELGIVGIALACLFVWLCVQKVNTPEKVIYAVCLVIAGLISLMAFPLQNAATAFLVAVLLGALSRGAPSYVLEDACFWRSGHRSRPRYCFRKRSIS